MDMHCGNLIANAAMPVLIDVEALLHPRPLGLGRAPREATDQSGLELLRARLRESVFSTGLLPLPPYVDPECTSAGFSTAARAGRSMAQNLPLLDDMPQLASRYVDDIVAGFEWMHRFLAQNVSALLREDGPLAPFAATRVRYIHRATQLYVKLIRASLDPTSLRDRFARRHGLRRLARALQVRGTVGEQWWIVLEDELHCVATLDVPRFTALPNSTSLWLSTGEELRGCLVEPSYKSMIRKLMKTRDSDASSQIKLIRAAYAVWEHVDASVTNGDAISDDGTDSMTQRELERLVWA
jgi:lantibiotic modifying enzyme